MFDLVTALLTATLTAGMMLTGVVWLLNREKGRIMQEIGAFGEGIAQDVAKEPKKYAALLKPIFLMAIDDMMADMSKGAKQGGGGLGGLLGSGLGAMANSPQGQDMMMQAIPKKWRGAAGLLLMFMGGKNPLSPTQSANQSASAFN